MCFGSSPALPTPPPIEPVGVLVIRWCESPTHALGYCGGALPMNLSVHLRNHFMFGATHRHNNRGRCVADESVGPFEEPLHVRGICVAAVMLAPRELSTEMTLVDRRHLSSPVAAFHIESFGPQQCKYTACIHSGHEAPLVVEPPGIALLWISVADEGEAGSTESNEFIGIGRDVAGTHASKRRLRGAVLHEISCHPVILASCQALHGLAEVAAQ